MLLLAFKVVAPNTDLGFRALRGHSFALTFGRGPSQNTAQCEPCEQDRKGKHRARRPKPHSKKESPAKRALNRGFYACAFHVWTTPTPRSYYNVAAVDVSWASPCNAKTAGTPDPFMS
jgi:hypothetical protein